MSKITPQMIKDLRDATGVGMGKCKEALEEAKGDIELAISNLRKAGMAQAVKKMDRETNEGIIKSATSSQALAIIEVNAETDFVVKNEKFQLFTDALAKEVLQIKPTSLVEFMQSRLSFDKNQTVDGYRASLIQTLGENIQIKRVELFVRKPNHSIALYSHAGGKLVCVVEISGANDQEEFAREIAMHIAAEAPEYLSQDEIPERVIEHEKEIGRAQIKGKPANIVDKILEGKLKAFYDQVCLLSQHYIKDTSLTIAALVEKRSKEIGKPLKVTQFLRWHVGAK